MITEFESAVLTLLDDQVINHSKPLSKDFFDRIERLKSKANIKGMHELPFIIADKSTECVLNWREANEYGSTPGSKWRLPSLDELDMIDKVCHDLEPANYWSSTTQYNTMAWFRSFVDGEWECTGQSHLYHVRLIKDI